MFNVTYKGRTLYRSLTYEECAEILGEYAQKFYDFNDKFDIDDFQIEEID